MKVEKFYKTFVLLVMGLVAIAVSSLTSCTDDEEEACPSMRIVAMTPYSYPIWHPTEEMIGFSHTPLKELLLDYDGSCLKGIIYVWDHGYNGFWLIDSDGSNQRRIFSSSFGYPSWSPDGQWLACEAYAQIFKIRFTGTTFDTASVTQLTSMGRNFSPTWSPDGQWIAYDRSLPDESGPGGIWIVKADGSERRHIIGGAWPSWHPDGNHLVYVGRDLEIFRVDIRDTSDVVKLVSRSPDIYDNRRPEYSPDGTKIAFAGQSNITYHGNIWVMNADGTQLRQVTNEGIRDWLDWSPDGRKIVYISYRADDWSYENGTIWTVDINTKEKQQLTFNYPPTQ